MDNKAVEALAEKLYTASDPEAAPWSRRGVIIRNVWLAAARDRLQKDIGVTLPEGL